MRRQTELQITRDLNELARLFLRRSGGLHEEDGAREKGLLERLAKLKRYTMTRTNDRFNDQDMVERPDGIYVEYDEVIKVIKEFLGKTEATTTANIPNVLIGGPPPVVSRLWARRWERKPKFYDDEEDK